MGWEPVVGAHVLEHVGYLAGADDSRRPISTYSPPTTRSTRSGAFAAATARCACSTRLDYDAWRADRRHSSATRTSPRSTRRSARAPSSSPFTDRRREPTLTDFSRSSLRAAVDRRRDRAASRRTRVTLRGGSARGDSPAEISRSYRALRNAVRAAARRRHSRPRGRERSGLSHRPNAHAAALERRARSRRGDRVRTFHRDSRRRANEARPLDDLLSEVADAVRRSVRR